MAWEKMCRPIDQGRLELKAFYHLNKAMIGRQVWKLYSKPSLLISKILRSKYGKQDGSDDFKNPQDASPLWKGMFPILSEMQKGLKWQMKRVLAFIVRIQGKFWDIEKVRMRFSRDQVKKKKSKQFLCQIQMQKMSSVGACLLR